VWYAYTKDGDIMKIPQKMTLAEIRLAIELLEDEAMAGRGGLRQSLRLVALRRERIRRVNAGLASLR